MYIIYTDILCLSFLFFFLSLSLSCSARRGQPCGWYLEVDPVPVGPADYRVVVSKRAKPAKREEAEAQAPGEWFIELAELKNGASPL